MKCNLFFMIIIIICFTGGCFAQSNKIKIIDQIKLDSEIYSVVEPKDKIIVIYDGVSHQIERNDLIFRKRLYSKTEKLHIPGSFSNKTDSDSIYFADILNNKIRLLDLDMIAKKEIYSKAINWVDINHSTHVLLPEVILTQNGDNLIFLTQFEGELYFVNLNLLNNTYQLYDTDGNIFYSIDQLKYPVATMTVDQPLKHLSFPREISFEESVLTVTYDQKVLSYHLDNNKISHKYIVEKPEEAIISYHKWGKKQFVLIKDENQIKIKMKEQSSVKLIKEFSIEEFNFGKLVIKNNLLYVFLNNVIYIYTI